MKNKIEYLGVKLVYMDDCVEKYKVKKFSYNESLPIYTDVERIKLIGYAREIRQCEDMLVCNARIAWDGMFKKEDKSYLTVAISGKAGRKYLRNARIEYCFLTLFPKPEDNRMVLKCHFKRRWE